jgi:serine/threonine-protein kinase HipA
MKHLFVWVWRPDGRISLAGELATTEPAPGSGRFESEFAYASEWTSARDAFALDPVSLPLDGASQRWRSQQFYPPLGIFDDALPDDWGRRLLAAAIKLDGLKATPPEMLLRMKGGGTGALIFTDRLAAPVPDRSVRSTALSVLLTAAAKFEAGTLPADTQFRKLIAGSSRAGGARPKALVHDDHGEWIAKFPSRSRDELHDVVGLEATCLELARHSGLNVPESRLQTLGRRRVLLVRRFDVTPRGGRIHMLSMQTLCRERPGIYVQSYSEPMQVLRKYSPSPAADVAAFFRHMVFNAAIGNVDDHLKNFWMLATPAGYRLAPAFDLVPDIAGRAEHTLSFQYGFACPDRAQLEALGDAWTVADAGAAIDRVVDAVAKFTATARKLKVRQDKRFERIAADIRRRVQLLK